MSHAKFEVARELIQEKHYDEARALLRTIDQPMATDWLTKLDRIDPPQTTNAPIPLLVQPIASQLTKAPRRIVTALIAFIAGALFGALLTLATVVALRQPQLSELQLRMTYYVQSVLDHNATQTEVLKHWTATPITLHCVPFAGGDAGCTTAIPRFAGTPIIIDCTQGIVLGMVFTLPAPGGGPTPNACATTLAQSTLTAQTPRNTPTLQH